MRYGLYEVTEGHTYRGHAAGTQFEARLDRAAEPRAMRRGVIRLLDTMEPVLQPGSYTFPEGWLSGPDIPVHRGAERRLFSGKE